MDVIRKAAILGLWLCLGTVLIFDCRADEMVVRPVETGSQPGQAVFPAAFDRVWTLLTQMVVDYQFEFSLKDKAAGRLGTQYAVFSRHPQFSRLAGGVRAYGIPPHTFWHKWLDGRIRVQVEVQQLSAESTRVRVMAEIQGFSSMSFDDAAVSGDWKDCRSNGKFEFEWLNELATRLKGASSNSSAKVVDGEASSSVESQPKPSKMSEYQKEDLTNLMLQSISGGCRNLSQRQTGGNDALSALRTCRGIQDSFPQAGLQGILASHSSPEAQRPDHQL
jgi:hypothetical protein